MSTLNAETSASINSEISDWLGDIVALESHVEEAMDGQLKMKGDSNLTGVIKHFHDSVRGSKKRAVEFQSTYGSEPGNPVIKAGSTVLGKAAGLIDKMRNDNISKSLRDDYTAFNHLAIAYTMLHTTAMAFDDQRVMSFAEQGLGTYARLVQRINQVMPDAVLYDLSSGDHAPVIKPYVADDCRATVERIWKTTSDA